MDIRSLLHNKWALGGVGVAAAAGAFALYKRKSSTGSTSSTGAQASPGYSAGGVGRFDSTGTDVAAWMGNYSQNLQNQLDQFKASLTPGTGATIPVAPGGTGGGPVPAPAPAPGPAPAPAPAAAQPGPEWINIFGGQGVDAWIKSLSSAGVAVDYGSLVNLNAGPLSRFGGLPGIINWKQGSGPNADHSKNTFKFDTALKVR